MLMSVWITTEGASRFVWILWAATSASAKRAFFWVITSTPAFIAPLVSFQRVKCALSNNRVQAEKLKQFGVCWVGFFFNLHSSQNRFTGWLELIDSSASQTCSRAVNKTKKQALVWHTNYTWFSQQTLWAGRDRFSNGNFLLLSFQDLKISHLFIG